MTRTTPKPLPTPLAMSAAPKDPISTPLPIRKSSSADPSKDMPTSETSEPAPHRKASEPCKTVSQPIAKLAFRPHPRPVFPSPKLRLECHDLSYSGSMTFFENVNPSTCLCQAVDVVLSTLYHPSKTNDHIPPTRSVTLILRRMDGVAYTCGSSLDDDHKEMHFSLDYIGGISSRTPGREADEIQGVLVHEMVHAWQWNGKGEAPGGLIEGIADFVRLKAKLEPPHWKREIADKWDQGYQHTAYFLEWLESSMGEGSVRRINDALKDEEYDENTFWQRLFGREVKDLWNEYKAYLEDESLQNQSPKPALGDDAFWNWVNARKSREETIVLRAVWRTKRYEKRTMDESSDDIGVKLQSLWGEYLDTLNETDERPTKRSRSQSSGESIGSDAALVAREISL